MECGDNICSHVLRNEKIFSGFIPFFKVDLYCLRFFRPLPKPRLCYNAISLKGVIRWPNEGNPPPSLRRSSFWRFLAVRVRKRSCVGVIISTKTNFQNGSSSFLNRSPTLFASADKPSSEVSEKRIAHLEQLVGKLTVVLDIQKKNTELVEITSSEKRYIVETLRTKYSVRQICQTLGFHHSLLYYHPKSDPSEAALEAQIEQLCRRYPTYGYRRITQLLANEGYPVGYRRVARLMKENHLLVRVKRACQTTRSLQGEKP